MSNGKGFRVLAALALGLAAMTGTASAVRADQPEGGDGKRIEKQRVVIVRDGKPKVFESGGPMVSRGYLGVALLDLTPELRTHFGAQEDSGVMVSKVEAGSPAEKAGIKVGDILAEVDGKPVKSSWDVRGKIRTYDDGQQVPVEIWRNGKAQNLTVGIVQRERPEWDMAPLFMGENGDHMKILDEGELPRDLLPRMQMHKMGSEDGRQVHVRVASPREIELEKKMKELEKRIDELQRQLEKKK